MNVIRIALATSIAALSGACVTTSDHHPINRQVSGSAWLDPSPALAQQIDDQAKKLPWTHGVDRVQAIQWFAKVGEPAYPKLLELAVDPNPDLAGSALAALGASGDRRLVVPLHQLNWPEPLDPTVKLERARAYTRLGDWSDVSVLIGGLRSESVFTRMLCAQTLRESTGETFGFDPRASDIDRDTAARKWEQWLQSRQGEGILASHN